MFDQLTAEQTRVYLDRGLAWVMEAGLNILLALVLLVVGLWLIRRVVALVSAGLERGPADATLTRFFTSITSIGLKTLLFISVISTLGVATTSFVAALGAAGLAVGLALQGSLSNFAGGVLILLFRPFRIGDYIEGQGVGGTVRDIQIFHTHLTTPDNKRVVVPNGPLANNNITNYSAETTRRVDFVFGIGYDDNLGQAKDVLERLFAADDRVLADPALLVVVSNLGASSVDLTVRAWVKKDDYWPLKWELTEQAKLAFDEAGISIPYPQTDVHLHQAD